MIKIDTNVENFYLISIEKKNISKAKPHFLAQLKRFSWFIKNKRN
jgi:hypothetical protein